MKNFMIENTTQPVFSLYSAGTDAPQLVGQLWVKNGQVDFTGDATASAQVFFKKVAEECDDHYLALQLRCEELARLLVEAERERDHCHHNHRAEVERGRLLKTRKDIPIERRLLWEALGAVAETGVSEDKLKCVVTKLDDLNHVLDVYHAALKLVQCKGRYHAELNYQALAALFGVRVPDPEAPAPVHFEGENL